MQHRQLTVDLGHLLFHLGNRLRCADASDHVLALRVDQVFAIDHVLAGARVACEADTGARVVAHVAKHHGADIHCCAIGLVLGDAELLAVVHRALAHPGAKHGTDRNFELFKRILRERLAGVLLDDGQEVARQFLQVVGAQVHVLVRTVLALDGIHAIVKMFVANIECDLAEQLDKAAISVIGKALVAGLGNQAFQRDIIKAEVENRVHHARHRHG